MVAAAASLSMKGAATTIRTRIRSGTSRMMATPDVRDKTPVNFSLHDYLTIRQEAEQAKKARRPMQELEKVARRWNLGVRTLYRYLRDPITTVHVNGWEAVYRTPADGPPRRVTRWTRADETPATRKEQEK